MSEVVIFLVGLIFDNLVRHDGVIVGLAGHGWFHQGGYRHALVRIVMLLEESVASAEVVSQLC